MYHRIDVLRPTLPELTHKLTVAALDFAAQMRWLKSHGYQTITQRQLYDALERGKPLPPKPVMLTFDDGYRDVFANASTVLHRLGMHATAYVITGRISGPDASFLTWPLLKGLERRGFDIGSHTVSHADLTSLPNSAAMKELVNSRRALERHLGHPVQWLAYPLGKEDPRVAELARRAGYVLAVTTQGGVVQDASAPLELHRYEVLDTTGVSGLASFLGG
jgi:peptidoglycan/xylan/chitin deacetylase (PgdA/CDA1 family)